MSNYTYNDAVPGIVNDYISDVILDHDRAIQEISPRGNGLTIKTVRPKNGIYAYVWRMARFYTGKDMHMPWCAPEYLTEGIKEAIDHDIKFYLITGDKKDIMDKMDKFTDEVLQKMNLDSNGCAKVWSGLL